MLIKLKHLPNSATGEQVSEALACDSAAIVDWVLSLGQVDEIMAELLPWIKKTKAGLDTFAGRNTRRIGALIARSPKCRERVMHPLALAAPERFSVTLPAVSFR